MTEDIEHDRYCVFGCGRVDWLLCGVALGPMKPCWPPRSLSRFINQLRVVVVFINVITLGYARLKIETFLFCFVLFCGHTQLSNNDRFDDVIGLVFAWRCYAERLWQFTRDEVSKRRVVTNRIVLLIGLNWALIFLVVDKFVLCCMQLGCS